MWLLFFLSPPFFLWISNSIAHTGPALGSHMAEFPALPPPLRRDRHRAPAAAAAPTEAAAPGAGRRPGQSTAPTRPAPGSRGGRWGKWGGGAGAGAGAAPEALSSPPGGGPACERGVWYLLRYWGHQASSVWSFPCGVECKMLTEWGPWRPPYTHTRPTFTLSTHLHVHTQHTKDFTHLYALLRPPPLLWPDTLTF